MHQVKEIIFIFLLYGFFFTNLITGDFVTTGVSYRKVSNTLPVELKGTLISSMPTRSCSNFRKLECLGACSRTENCTLACYDDDDCNLYYALVSTYWDPNKNLSSTPLETLVNFSCYSSWYFSRDITNQIVAIKESSLYGGTHYSKYSLNGFYGIKSNNAFASQINDNSWIEYSFSSPIFISKLVIKVVTYQAITFANVSAYIGDTPSTNGDFGSFTLIKRYPNSASPGDVIVFFASRCLQGKVVALNMVPQPPQHFMIGDFKILGCE